MTEKLNPDDFRPIEMKRLSEIAIADARAKLKALSHPNNITDFTTERLRRSPISYSIDFTHTHDQLQFVVHDIAADSRSKLAVADDLEKAAKSLREAHSE